MITKLVNLLVEDYNLSNYNELTPLLATAVEAVCMLKQSQNETIKTHIDNDCKFIAAFSAIAEPLKVIFLEGLLPPPINMSPLNLCLFKDGGGESNDEFEMELGESPVPLGYTSKKTNFFTLYSKLKKDYFACISEPCQASSNHNELLKHICRKVSHNLAIKQNLDALENTSGHNSKAEFYDNNYWVTTVVVDEVALIELTNAL